MRHYPRGQSLLEIVASIGIFVVVITSLSGAFLQLLSTERRVLATQNILDSARYTIEVMTRAIRQADPNTLVVGCGGSCLTFHHPNVAKDCPATSSGTMTYALSSSSITECSGTTTDAASCATACSPVAISASNTSVSKLQFIVSGGGSSDGVQPRVTIVMQLVPAPTTGETVNLETTVGLRSLQE